MAKTHTVRVSKRSKKSGTAVKGVYRKADEIVAVREAKTKSGQ